MKTIVYQGYTIKSFPQQQLKSNQWAISLEIFCEHDGVTTVKSFTAETHYATEEDADLNGISYGQDIIDGKVSGLSLD